MRMQFKVSINAAHHDRYAFVVRWKEGTASRKKYFTKGQKQAAQLFRQQKEIELKNHGTKHGTISDEERAALITFRNAVAAMPEPRPSLRDCVNSYLATIANQLKPITIHELVALRARKAEEKGVHERTLRDLIGVDGTKGRLGAFAATFGDRQAAAISSEEIRQWTKEQCKTEANRREMLIRLKGLFAAGVMDEFITKNPIDSIPLPRANPARAHILSVAECVALLASCPERSQAAFTVQLFAGLRKAEAGRVDWRDVDFESNTIRVIQRKGGGARREKARFAPIPPVLRSWLEPLRQLAGPIFPIGRTKGKMSEEAYDNDFEKARLVAGIKTWDENTLRHTFGSNRVADIKDLEQVKIEMGHTTSRTTSEHYVNAVRSADAAAFWRLDRTKITVQVSPTSSTKDRFVGAKEQAKTA